MDKQKWSKGKREVVIEAHLEAGEMVVPLKVVKELLDYAGFEKQWHLKTKDAD